MKVIAFIAMPTGSKRELAIKHGAPVRNSPETQHYGDLFRSITNVVLPI